jgi:hypothetical protein
VGGRDTAGSHDQVWLGIPAGIPSRCPPMSTLTLPGNAGYDTGVSGYPAQTSADCEANPVPSTMPGLALTEMRGPSLRSAPSLRLLRALATRLGLPRFDGQVDYAASRRGCCWICCSYSTGVR